MLSNEANWKTAIIETYRLADVRVFLKDDYTEIYDNIDQKYMYIYIEITKILY